MNAIGADSNDWDKHFLLCADIDLSDYTGTEFNIIGINYYNPFTGVFDGNGHTISNLTYDSNDRDYIGLFGYVSGENALIKNLGLIDPNLDAGIEDIVGSLVSNLRNGIINNCYVEGGSVSGEWSIGGLVGNSDGTIWNCYSTGDVNGVDDVGGLVGRNYGSISNCYSTGDVSGSERVGGLVGWGGRSNVSNCYSTGDVKGDLQVGCLIGHSYNESVSNCFWDTDTQTHGVTVSFGYIHESTVINVTGLPTAQMQTQSTFTDAGWDFISERYNGTTETWQMPAGGGYPMLSFFHMDIPVPLSGSGTEEQPYLVSDANELGIVSWYPGGCHFKMTTDIDLSGIHWSMAVVNLFSGFFDGDGHRVLNMQISGINYLGIFGYVEGRGQINNLGFEGNYVSGIFHRVGGLVGVNFGNVSNCYSAGDVNGGGVVGGIVGVNFGNVSNCYSTSDVNGFYSVGGLVAENQGSISNCYSTSVVNGVDVVGGLVGFNFGYVSNCYSVSSFSGGNQVGGLVGFNGGGIEKSYSTGDIGGVLEVGGLVGFNYGGIENCYSTGDVNGFDNVGGLVGNNDSHIVRCYSTGNVSGSEDIGGLVGYNNSPMIKASFWDVITSGQTTSAGGTGLPTADMQTESTYTDAGWDFIMPIWKMNCEGMSYPKLSWWQPLAGDFGCPDGVNFFDFSFFASHWAEDNCAASNDCDGRDLDLLGSVDINDLRIFADNWLEGF
ncbi:MAG: GLUG motif-containing protein [Planctomycetota bacterium]